ncbi:MAG: hypothetical protein KJO21_07140 [Verrucomicrobiae bacterium]|nr:hypothetical protein [Verrucomicrobiae bacterium]NNJ43249.1 hypothetical protein [Akkermansiaceae bacterium]
MKIHHLLIIPLIALLASCSSNPTTRIQKNPALYRQLPTEHQELVSQGKIARGMTPPAVFLAMGNPDSKTTGEQHGKNFERWNYNVMVPVYSHSFSPHYGSRYGRCGYRNDYYGLGLHPSVHYTIGHSASVQFSKGKVTEWNSVRKNF